MKNIITHRNVANTDGSGSYGFPMQPVVGSLNHFYLAFLPWEGFEGPGIF